MNSAPILFSLFSFCLASITTTAIASAQSRYADPPDQPRPYRGNSYEDPRPCPDIDPPEPFRFRRSQMSPVRLHIGGALRPNTDSVTPGLLTAIDFGRGPAGFRLTGAWLQVGNNDGIAQYTGELTLDLGRYSQFRPVVAAGAGLVRTQRVDEQGNYTSGGAWLGIGTVRATVEYMVPLEDADARVGLSLIGSLPAIRGDMAPDLNPWLIAALTVGVGF